MFKDTTDSVQVPGEFAKLLSRNKAAEKHYYSFTLDWQKSLIHKLNLPKTLVAKERALQTVIELCEKNVTAQEYREFYLGQKAGFGKKA